MPHRHFPSTGHPPRWHEPWPLNGWARIAALLLAIVLVGLGAALLWVGVELIGLGGTWYYALAGGGFVVAAVLLALGRIWPAVLVLGLCLIATLIWALAEVAAKGFLPAWGLDLAARGGLPLAFFGVAVLLVLLGTPRRVAPGPYRLTAAVAVAGVALGVVALLAVFWERAEGPADPVTAASATTGPGHNAAGEWSAYGGSSLGAAFTPADQIRPDTLDRLTEVWRARTGDLPPNERVFFSSQNTPLYVDGRLLVCTPSNIVLALDPATGDELWRFDPQVPVEAMESLFSVACRAVAHAALPAADTGCAAHVFVTTVDSRLFALDAETGAPCAGFGADGVVDLSEGMGLREVGFASSTSGPAVVGDLVVIGQQVSDNQRRDAPSGVVRAYDTATGELRWAWDALRQGIAAEPLAEGEIYPRGTPNVWNVISGDAEAGLVYIGTGNSGNDHFGGTRTEEEDRFTAAIVAIDMETGETVWDFATIVHDLWDYDLGAQPALMDLEIDGAARRVVVQATKQGSIYVLDAATGEHLRPVEMRPAPQGALPGDWTAEAQPQAVFYPNLSGLPGPDPEVLTPAHTWGLAMLDAAMCRRDFHRMDYRGTYTPPSENPHGMLLFPGTIGGMNWGGVGLDLGRNIVVTNHSRLPNKVTMHPRDQVDEVPVGDGGARPDQAIAPHWLSPWGVTRPIWLSDLEVPCIAPPWGIIAATDLDTGALLWSRPLGTGYDSGPMGLPTFLSLPMGTANVGGPLVTATGLTFIAAAQDNVLRGYQTGTGRLLWRARLPAGGQASPMSFVHDGRQYLVMVATGHARLETDIGDHVVAFALEE